MCGKKVGFYGGKMLPLHLGHIYSILYSASRCDELHVFLFVNIFGEDELIEKSIFQKDLLQPNIRELILKYEFDGFRNIKLHTIDAGKCFKISNNGQWDYNSSAVIDSANCLPNIVFSSELAHKEHFKKLYPFAEFEVIDVDRSFFNISSSKIRNEGAFKNWDYLPKSYKSLCSIPIIIFGEREIKTRLILDLAKLFCTSFIGSIDCDGNELQKRLLEARFNSNKVFFISSADENGDKYIPFYNIHSYRFSVNSPECDIHKYKTIDLSGAYDVVLKQAILRVKAILSN